MINESELKIKVLTSKPKIITFDNVQAFVKIEHLPSEITVTKHNKYQYKARDEAMEELEVLVELWEGSE